MARLLAGRLTLQQSNAANAHLTDGETEVILNYGVWQSGVSSQPPPASGAC
jgi:hypothetical protein